MVSHPVLSHSVPGRTILITSATPVSAELAAEFGRLPPAFLPLGNRRLFWWQHAALRPHFERIVLSLPADFAVPARDQGLLRDLGITTIAVPPGLRPADSLLHCLSRVGGAGALALLQGDTLLTGIEQGPRDAVSVAAIDHEPAPGSGQWENHAWGYVMRRGRGLAAFVRGDQETIPSREVLTGYARIANRGLLTRCLVGADGDLLAALDNYHKHRRMRPVRAARWINLGHVGSFHRAQTALTDDEADGSRAERHFARKTGGDHARLSDEAAWFEQLPPALRPFTPAFCGRMPDGYAVETLPLPALSDLLVFGRAPPSVWTRIFNACGDFMDVAARIDPPALPEVGVDLRDATLRQLESVARSGALDLDVEWRINGRPTPSLRRIAIHCADAIGPTPRGLFGWMHGDFRFSNILFDQRAGRIRVINPLGRDAAGRPSGFGDRRQELGALYQSAVGLHDMIMAGYYRIRQTGTAGLDLDLPRESRLDAIASLFRRHSFAGLLPEQARAGETAVLRCLGTLAHHAEDEERRMAVLANGLRLFLAVAERVGAGF